MRIRIFKEYDSIQDKLNAMDFKVDVNQAYKDIHPNSLVKLLAELKGLGIQTVQVDL